MASSARRAGRGYSTYNDAEIDLLKPSVRVPTERHYMNSSYRMKSWEMILYAFNLLASRLWWGADEWKNMNIPRKWLRSVHDRAMQELKREGTGDVPGFLSRNDILCALLAKIASEGCWSSGQPVLMLQSTNVRGRVQSVSFLAGVATVGNFTNATLTDMPAGRVREGSVGEIAAYLWRTTEAHNQGDQMDAMTSIWRYGLDTVNPLIMGRWKMYLITFSNWARGTSFQLDFSAVRTSRSASPTPLRSCVALPFLAMETNFLALPSFWLMGPDESGGYWVTGTLSKARWSQAAEVFARFGV